MTTSRSISTLLSLLAILLLLPAAPSRQQNQIPLDPEEDDALRTLYSAWLVNVYPYGCDNRSGDVNLRNIRCSCDRWVCNVVYIDLSGASLRGVIPDVFGAFVNLSHLDLSRNYLEGPIPPSIGNLDALEFLDLSFNRINGTIPRSFRSLQSLHYMYLGNNNLTGDIPLSLKPPLKALDISFNPIDGSFLLTENSGGLSINFLGTSMGSQSMLNRSSDFWKKLGIFHCLHNQICDSEYLNYNITSFAINCGGNNYSSSSVSYYGDLVINGAASYHIDSGHQWAESNIGSDEGGRIVATDRQINGFSDPELYKTAMTSPKSLRYFIFGVKNGKYRISLHFAEIKKDLLPRFFDIYIQGERVLTDFNILRNASHQYYKAVVVSFTTHVNTSLIDIHFLQAARWNCCGIRNATLGPLVSAINFSRVEEDPYSRLTRIPHTGFDDSEALKRRGRVAGVVLLCTSLIFVAASAIYLWWIKERSTGHIQINTDSPRS